MRAFQYSGSTGGLKSDTANTSGRAVFTAGRSPAGHHGRHGAASVGRPQHRSDCVFPQYCRPDRPVPAAAAYRAGAAENPTLHRPSYPQPGRRQCHVLLFLGPGPYAVNRSLSGETVGALIYATAGIVVAERAGRALQLAGAADRLWRLGGTAVAAS